MRIGVDVGGTHTDAVLLDGGAVVSSVKALTSADVSSGILNALECILGDSKVAESDIEAVMLGTTQFTNAVIERRELSGVAAIRVGLPSGRGLPPMVGWPEDIAECIGGGIYELEGGHLYDGTAMPSATASDVERVVDDIKRQGLNAIAVASVFSPMAADAELELEARLLQAIPDAHITLSHRIGRLGLLERENAALLNSSLLSFADRVVSSFRLALDERGLGCPFFISQNDGTLMNAEFVRQFPALTFASGPTNSLRGASRLTGLDDAIVVDIGGTTSDIGVLQDGFPRESNVVIEVGGVRTNFRMPDLLALGVGGGSLVHNDGRQIGPTSVGHDLVTRGLVFGGDTLTTTDLTVAAGKAAIGDAALVSGLDARVVERGLQTIMRMLDAGIDTMTPSSRRLPVILVGGGTALVTGALQAASEVLVPEHSGVANAIGAAIAQVGGEAERMVNYRELDRKDALKQVSAEAAELAVAAGADRDTIAIADVEETAISYMDDGMTRLRIKAVGDIAALNEGGPS